MGWAGAVDADGELQLMLMMGQVQLKRQGLLVPGGRIHQYRSKSMGWLILHGLGDEQADQDVCRGFDQAGDCVPVSTSCWPYPVKSPRTFSVILSVTAECLRGSKYLAGDGAQRNGVRKQ